MAAKWWEDTLCGLQVSSWYSTTLQSSRVCIYIYCGIHEIQYKLSIIILFWIHNWNKFLFRGGICIWAASYPGNAASVRSGIASFSGTLSWGSGIRWTLVDFLRCFNDEQISALSWSPNGRYPKQLPFDICICYLFAKLLHAV